MLITAGVIGGITSQEIQRIYPRFTETKEEAVKLNCGEGEQKKFVYVTGNWNGKELRQPLLDNNGDLMKCPS